MPSSSWTHVKSVSRFKQSPKINIPPLLAVDTNCDPDEIDAVTLSNDDYPGAISLIVKSMADVPAIEQTGVAGIAAEESTDKAFDNLSESNEGQEA